MLEGLGGVGEGLKVTDMQLEFWSGASASGGIEGNIILPPQLLYVLVGSWLLYSTYVPVSVKSLIVT